MAYQGEDQADSSSDLFFLKEGETAVTSVSATITAPVAGAKPDVSAVSGNSAQYSVAVNQNGWDGTYRWYKGGDVGNPGELMTDEDVFESGNTYIVELVFNANAGYALCLGAPESQVTLNGETGGLACGYRKAEMALYRFALDVPEKAGPESFLVRVNVATWDVNGVVIAGPGGTASADKAQVATGETVTVTATPNEGYVLESIGFSNGVVGEQDGLSPTWTVREGFAGPDVVVDVIFREQASSTYLVTFDMNGKTGTEANPNARNVASGDTVAKPTDPVAAGYFFAGWYVDAACTTAFDFSTPITANTTLYARWIPKAIGYTMNVTGATQSGSNWVLTTDAQAVQFEVGTAPVTIDSPLLYTDAACSTLLSTAPEKGTTYYALVSIDGGGLEGEPNVYWDDAMKTASTATASNGATLAYTDLARSPGGRWATVIFSYTEPAVTYLVTFDMNGKTGTEANPNARNVASGDTVAKPTDPAASGYVFEGWCTDAACTTAFDFSTPITADLTLYAKWAAVAPTYAFTAGDGSTWTKGSTTPLDFTVKRSYDDASTFGLFTDVKIDGTTLAAANYATSSGSLNLSLNASYLEGLSEGAHMVEVAFADGTATGSFTVQAKAAEGGSSAGGNSNGNANGNASGKALPQTSDAAPVAPLVATAILAALAAAAAFVMRRRYE